ncbi:hypothetical protein REPUB_Repub07fG0140500 [Reevesia pubescens]
MRRGESHGGGQSSLGYLFGSDHQQPSKTPAPSTSIKAPWDDDNTTKKPPDNSSKKLSITNNYHRAQGQNLDNFITHAFTLSRKTCS